MKNYSRCRECFRKFIQSKTGGCMRCLKRKNEIDAAIGRLRKLYG